MGKTREGFWVPRDHMPLPVSLLVLQGHPSKYSAPNFIFVTLRYSVLLFMMSSNNCLFFCQLCATNSSQVLYKFSSLLWVPRHHHELLLSTLIRMLICFCVSFTQLCFARWETTQDPAGCLSHNSCFMTFYLLTDVCRFVVGLFL